MGEKKRKNTKKSQDSLPLKIALATALIQLISQLLELLNKLLE